MSSEEKSSRIKVSFLPSPLWSHCRSTGLCPCRHSPRKRERGRVLGKNSLVSPNWLGKSQHSFLFLERWTLIIRSDEMLWQCINRNRVDKGEAVAYGRTVRWMYIILMVFKNFKEFVHGKKPTVLFFCFEQYIVEPYEIAIVVGGTWPDVGKCHKFSIMYMYLFGYINW